MRVVVAGANGLIGKHLLMALQRGGHEAIALARRAAGSAGWSSGARVLEWDGRSQGPWAAAVDGADAVVSMAGAPVAGKRWSDAWKKEIHDSRVDSSRALVDAMRAAARRPRAFIAGSAVGYYGFGGDKVLDESAPPGTDFLARVCVDWEDESRKAEPLGVRTVLLRTGVVLARDGGALSQMLPPFKAFVGGPIGGGQQWFPWVHIADEVGLILWSIERELRGPLNAVAPDEATMGGFTRALGSALHRPSWLPVPGFALRLLLGESASMVTGSQRVAPKAALASGYAFEFPKLDAALADLVGR